MRKKTELYSTQQDELIEKIIDILDLDEENSITLYELDNDKEKINKIMELIPELRLYFTFGQIIGLFKPSVSQRPYLSIIRCITKKLYIMERSDYRIGGGRKGLRTIKYIFKMKTT
jgi:hypothetical protein